MTNLTVLCDMDDVLWNLLTPWIAEINRTTGANIKEESITDWDISKFIPYIPAELIYAPLYKKSFWSKLQPYDDAQWFIWQLLIDGHEVKIVTAPAYSYKSMPAKIDNFLRLFPMVRQENIIITKQKQLIIGDVLIDDAPHNLVGGSYTKILLNKTSNSNYDATQHEMIRVSTLTEAYGEIRRLSL